MTRSISAVFENGVFRPTEPVNDIPEHAPVRLTVESAPTPLPERRTWGLQRGKILHVAPDFDEELGDDFWLGENA